MNNIVEKIKKLLALARSSNEAEARLAAEKASELLLKYNLSMAEVEAGASKEGVYSREDIVTDASRSSIVEETIFSLLQSFFFVVVVRSRTLKNIKGTFKNVIVITYLGRRENVEIAKYIYDFLKVQFNLRWKEYKKLNPGAKKKDYIIGLYSGLYKQLEDKHKSIAQGSALVVSENNSILNFMRQCFNEVKESKNSKVASENPQTVLDGIEHGKNMNIAAGVGSGSEQPKAVGQTLRLTGGQSC